MPGRVLATEDITEWMAKCWLSRSLCLQQRDTDTGEGDPFEGVTFGLSLATPDERVPFGKSPSNNLPFHPQFFSAGNIPHWRSWDVGWLQRKVLGSCRFRAQFNHYLLKYFMELGFSFISRATLTWCPVTPSSTAWTSYKSRCSPTCSP